MLVHMYEEESERKSLFGGKKQKSGNGVYCGRCVNGGNEISFSLTHQQFVEQGGSTAGDSRETARRFSQLQRLGETPGPSPDPAASALRWK